MKKYSLLHIDNQEENYLVDENQLAQFLESRQGMWIIQQLQEFDPPAMESPEDRERRKKYEREKHPPFPVPLSRVIENE